MELHELTIKEASDKLASNELSAKELTESLLARAKSLNPKLNAYLAFTEDRAFSDASAADQAIADGTNLPLTGIPFAVKDNILIKGIQATAASKILKNYKATYTASSMTRVMEQLPVLLGKTNLDEFAMGSSTENSAFGPTHNPFDLERVPGGSSGGSAVAVASGSALFAFGTDTGGSVRQPAAFCGIVGLKPTYGRISRYGLIAMGSSLDQLGIMAKTVEDVALVCQTVAGQDEWDSTTLPIPVPDYQQAMQRENLKGFKIGIPKEYFTEGMDKEVEASVKAAIKKLEELGAVVEEVSLPHTKYSLSSYYIIMPVEVSANLARYDGIRYGLSAAGETLEDVYLNSRSEGFGAEPKRRIMIGTYASSAGYADQYYKKAKQAQKLIRKDFVEVFKKYDLLVTPTTPTTAFKLGERSQDPLSMYLADIFTVALNIAGVPGLAMPVGVSSQGLPIGMQLIGPHFGEDKLFAAGRVIERALNLKIKPKL
ncbi:MAG: Asp-tRNA(Asn)/Glu-tRNA(Gln) amidotransferase subunit GatA [Acidobacteriaceae bacterium]